jgi:hypothetical protein
MSLPITSGDLKLGDRVSYIGPGYKRKKGNGTIIGFDNRAVRSLQVRWDGDAVVGWYEPSDLGRVYYEEGREEGREERSTAQHLELARANIRAAQDRVNERIDALVDKALAGERLMDNLDSTYKDLGISIMLRRGIERRMMGIVHELSSACTRLEAASRRENNDA